MCNAGTVCNFTAAPAGDAPWSPLGTPMKRLLIVLALTSIVGGGLAPAVVACVSYPQTGESTCLGPQLQLSETCFFHGMTARSY